MQNILMIFAKSELMKKMLMNILDNLTVNFVKQSQEILGDNLVGIYLHGSAVMGCFNEKRGEKYE